MKKTKKPLIAVKALFTVILASKVLAENTDYYAKKYGLDPDLFSSAVYELFEMCATIKE